MDGRGQESAANRGKVISEKPAIKTRIFPNWIDGFVDYTSSLPSPDIFRKWTAISILAGALERKVWVYTYGQNLYPNLYIVNVAPPAVGKTIVSSLASDFWGALPDHFVAPSAVSRASLIDALREAERKLIKPTEVPSVITFNSLLVAVNELGVFIPSYDNEFMNTLTDLWDNKRYAEKKRTKELNFVMHSPQLNILGSTTPAYLTAVMPEGAWDQGFISRVILVYSGEARIRSLFATVDTNEKVKLDLIKDLKIIGDIYGKLKFTPEAASAVDNWHLEGGPPVPDHPRLKNYAGRRTTQILKLSMVASLARNNELVIELEDFHTALSWLLDAESHMPDIFKSMSSGGDSRVITDAHHFVMKAYVQEKNPVSEARIIEFLQSRIPAHSVERVLLIMTKAKLLEKQIEGYKPMMRTGLV